ncbi:MAG: response regulator [Sulfuricellaceae bacterium]|jgi:DNA-binding NarL/FixJ family response regulator
MTSRAPEDVIKIMIVDDHPIVRQGIALLFDSQDDMRAVCEAGSGEEALASLTRSDGACADLMVVDLSLEGMSGLDLIKAVRSRFPEMPMLVMSMHDESFYAERVLRAGARGYIMKQEATEKILTAVRQILRGGIYVSDKMQTRMLQRLVDSRGEQVETPLSALSDRELEVLRLIGRGLSTGEIARDLHRSVKTVEAHRANIKEKLNLKNAAELVRYAIQWVEQGE